MLIGGILWIVIVFLDYKEKADQFLLIELNVLHTIIEIVNIVNIDQGDRLYF